jgi:uncharacterized protein YwgA
MRISFPEQKESKAWVAAAVSALRERGSWTGRIHIHKLLFIVKVLKLAKPPFKFQLYQYGPYSFGLDAVIADMDLDGEISREYPNPGYGPRYELSTEGANLRKLLSSSDAKVIQRVADQLKRLNSTDLELVATCLWVEQKEHIAGEEQIIGRVREIKPNYTESQIGTNLSTSRKIVKSLLD